MQYLLKSTEKQPQTSVGPGLNPYAAPGPPAGTPISDVDPFSTRSWPPKVFHLDHRPSVVHRAQLDNIWQTSDQFCALCFAPYIHSPLLLFQY